MRSTSFDPLPADLEARTAIGYDARHFSDELGVADPSPEFWSEAGLWSCVDDLARWLAFQMEGTTSAEREVLSETTRREMHRPRYLLNEMWTAAMGIGWAAVRADKVTWVFHGGGIYGFTTHVCFDPKERVGAIAMINGIGSAGQLAMDLAKIAWEAVHEAAPPIEPPPATPGAWRALLGLYTGPFGSMIRVEWRDGKLTIVDPSIPFLPRLSPTETADDFVVDPGGEEWGDHIRFIRTADGRVKAVLLNYTTFVRLDPVQ